MCHGRARGALGCPPVGKVERVSLEPNHVFLCCRRRTPSRCSVGTAQRVPVGRPDALRCSIGRPLPAGTFIVIPNLIEFAFFLCEMEEVCFPLQYNNRIGPRSLPGLLLLCCDFKSKRSCCVLLCKLRWFFSCPVERPDRSTLVLLLHFERPQSWFNDVLSVLFTTSAVEFICVAEFRLVADVAEC